MILRWGALLWGSARCCFPVLGNVTWIGRPTAVEATVLTVWEGHRAVAQVTVEDHVETRWQGHPHLHHVTHEPSGVGTGHSVPYSELETSVPSLGVGPRNNSGCPYVHDGQLRWHGARRVRWALSRGNHPPHHLQIGVLIVITIQFCPEAWLFQVFPVTQTNLSEPMVAAKQGEDLMWR